MSGDYHGNGGGYRRMGHFSGSHPSLSRNLTSFLLLLALGAMLVLFVYTYSSYSNEEQLLHEEITRGGDELRKLKDELLEVHTKLEEETKRLNGCSAEKSRLETENKELSTKTSTLQRSINELEEKLRNSTSEMKRLEARLVDADKSAKQVEQKLANLTATRNAQETQLADLHKIVDSMKAQAGGQPQQQQALRPATPPAAGEAVMKRANVTSGKGATGGEAQVAGGEAKPAASGTAAKDNKTPAKGAQVIPSEKPPLQQGKDKKDGGTKLAGGGDTAGEVDAELEKDAQLHKDLREGQGSFLAARQPGGRMKLEEAKAIQAEQDKEGNASPLLVHAAAKQQQQLVDAGGDGLEAGEKWDHLDDSGDNDGKNAPPRLHPLADADHHDIVGGETKYDLAAAVDDGLEKEDVGEPPKKLLPLV